MGIIGWIILGLLAGLIAKAILPGEQPGGIIVAALVGIAGALIAGFIAQAVGFGDPIDEFFDWSTWIAAIVGAVVLLLIWQAIAGEGSPAEGRLARPGFSSPHPSPAAGGDAQAGRHPFPLSVLSR